MSTSKRALIGFVAVGLLMAAFPIAAQAQSEYDRPQTDATDEHRAGSLADAKARVIKQVEQRLQILDRLVRKVTTAMSVTDQHEAALLGDYEKASRILVAGLDTVAATETLQELREVAPPIFESTLVKALLVPKTKAVGASDYVASVTARFERIESRLGEALDRLAAAGIDVSRAEDDLAKAERLVADAVTIGSAVADRVIALQPGDEIRKPLSEAKSDLQHSRRLLGEARASVREVIRFVWNTMSNQDGEG